MPESQTVVGLITKRVQTMLADMGSDWTDPDYIWEKLAIVNDDLEMELQALDLNFDTQVVILPNVPANTTSLADYQTIGKPLEGMVLIKALEWRLVGQNDEQWQPVPQVQKVVDTNTGTSVAGSPVASNYSTVQSYEVRAGIVQISPCNVPVDLRVRMQNLPVNVDSDAPNQPIRGVTNILAYDTALLIIEVRGGEKADSIYRGLSARRARAFAFFTFSHRKAKQSQNLRLGSRRQGGGVSQWRSPLVNNP